MTTSQPDALSIGRFARLVTRFDEAPADTRVEILDAFREKGAEGVRSLLDLLIEAEARRNVGYRVAGLAIIALVTLGIVLGREAADSSHPTAWLLLPIAGSFVLLLVLARFLLPGKTEKNARIILACLHETLDNPAAIGPLLEGFGEYVDPRVNTWNMLALQRLLPDAGAGDLYRLNVRQRSALRRIFSHAGASKNLEQWRNTPGLYVDVLVLLLRFASLRPDEDLILPVRRLAEMTPHTEPEHRVQEAAAACLPLLKSTPKQVS